MTLCCYHSAVGKELVVFGGTDSEESETRAQGVYIFDTGELWH